MKHNKVLNWILTLTILSFLATLIVYWYLPDQIPIHWGVNGNPDSYGHRSFALLLGVMPLVLYLLMLVIPKIDPRKESFEHHKKTYNITRILLIMFFIVVHWITIFIALGYELDISLIMPIMVGILFVFIGNYLPRIRNNYFFGIRTPWTLANETVWRKTHRFGGHGFIVGGVLFLVLTPFSSSIKILVPIVYLVSLVVVLFLYSYLEYNKITRN